MLRRIFLRNFAACTVAALLVPSAFAEQPIPPFHVWVRQIYEHETARHLALVRSGGAPQSMEEYLAPFARDVRDLIRDASNRIMPNTEPDGPVLNTYFGWGALPGREILLKGVTARGADKAMVEFTVNGAARSVIVTGRNDGGSGWGIADISYGAGSLDASYVERLRRMTTWKKRD
ncbi:MAG: hypothetical protein ABWZ80_05985 [Beijerinckiaceae bacterium]